MKNPSIVIRAAQLSDLEEMQQLFLDTVTNVCGKDYDEEQIHAWTSGVENKRRWLDRFEEQIVLLAIIGKQVAGFGTIKDGNYIDMLFVHQDFQGQGIACDIYSQLERKAKELNSDHITADVSITARTFFERMGFTVLTEQKIERLGVELVNYKMTKRL